MAIKTTEWSPDTCDCQIDYEWDDSLPQEQITYNIKFLGKSCNAHKNLLPNAPVTYSCILDENQKKNKSLQLALENAPSQLADIFTSPVDGSQTVTLKHDIIFTFSFTGTAPNRVLTIQFVGASLNSNQKNSIQNKLNQIFGNGNVVII